jgi:hypothetical protein
VRLGLNNRGGDFSCSSRSGGSGVRVSARPDISDPLRSSNNGSSLSESPIQCTGSQQFTVRLETGAGRRNLGRSLVDTDTIALLCIPIDVANVTRIFIQDGSKSGKRCSAQR